MIINEKKMAQLAINKSLLKEYSTNEDSRVVYMDNNDEFQIQLFNPEQFTVGVTFTFNGKDMDGMLVLKPGERVWLERYLDNQVKFKFSTYEVDDNDVQVKHAIANNGNITVKFYKERVSSRIKTNIYNTLNVLWKESPLISNENTYTVPSYDTVVTCSDTNNNVLLTNNVTNCCCASIDGNTYNKALYKTNVNDTTIETGRIENGGYSNQKFETVNNEFENYPFKTEYIKILPKSRKPYTTSDLNKIYCTNCGRKLNSKFKFCPYCGEKCVIKYLSSNYKKLRF